MLAYKVDRYIHIVRLIQSSNAPQTMWKNGALSYYWTESMRYRAQVRRSSDDVLELKGSRRSDHICLAIALGVM